MGLQDFITPDETIKYRSPTPVEYQGDYYGFLITSKRLIWYKQSGLIFKKDNFVCELLENVKSISFKEEGIINKRGIVRIVMGDRNLLFSGSLSAMRAIYNEAQSLISIPQRDERVVREIIKEPIYLHEKTIDEEGKIYICKVCENSYSSKAEALSCEKSHRKKKHIKRKVSRKKRKGKK